MNEKIEVGDHVKALENLSPNHSPFGVKCKVPVGTVGVVTALMPFDRKDIQRLAIAWDTRRGTYNYCATSVQVQMVECKKQD